MARRAFGESVLPEAERDARRLARWYIWDSHCHIMIYSTHEPCDECRTGIANAARIDTALSELAELGLVRPAAERAGVSPSRKRGDWTVNGVANPSHGQRRNLLA
jgi:hypothetical protein